MLTVKLHRNCTHVTHLTGKQQGEGMPGKRHQQCREVERGVQHRPQQGILNYCGEMVSLFTMKPCREESTEWLF